MALQIFLFFTVYAVSTAVVFYFMSYIQPSQYMDELFHIPQARNYCAGNFSYWDPMITTLPGLYLVSVGIIQPISTLISNDPVMSCSTFWLRATNLLFMMGNFYLIYALLKKLQFFIMDSDSTKACLTTLSLSTFPILYFFTFLYYTDPGSTFCVLFMYLFSLHGNHYMAAILGVVAIFFRQTNIVWVVFVAGLAVGERLKQWVKQERKDMTPQDFASDLKLLQTTIDLLVDKVRKDRKQILHLVVAVVIDTIGYILVGLGFAVFIYINEGIVVGDRSHHQACLNFPQIFYFLSVTNVFACVYLISPWKVWYWIKACIYHPVISAAFIAITTVFVYNFSYVHEYTLADNRHYTFYVWAKIYRRHDLVKYVLIPGYMYCAWSMITALKHKDVFWKIMFTLCVILTTVPQKMLEFRYFILPYLIFRLNVRYSTMISHLHEFVLYFIVNMITIYLFAEKPFRWTNSNDLQRFIW